jgi:hypothetical protein
LLGRQRPTDSTWGPAAAVRPSFRRTARVSLAASQRYRAVVTVVGEHPVERAIARAYSPASTRATILRFARRPETGIDGR